MEERIPGGDPSHYFNAHFNREIVKSVVVRYGFSSWNH
jgi:hypothetical protein